MIEDEPVLPIRFSESAERDLERMGVEGLEDFADLIDKAVNGEVWSSFKEIETEFTLKEQVKFHFVRGQQITQASCTKEDEEDIEESGILSGEGKPPHYRKVIEFDFDQDWTVELYDPQFSPEVLGNALITFEDGRIDLQATFGGFQLQGASHDGQWLAVTLGRDETAIVINAPAWIVEPINT